MKITIETISLKNFKGIREKTIKFKGNTNISAFNGVGKTTIFDAYLWLMFNKNSQYDTNFNIKPLTDTGEPEHRIESEVEAVIFTDGMKHTLRKVYKEKWTKKRGTQDEELTGHTTDYFFDEVPMTVREYQSKIDSFVNEEAFRILSDVSYFNSMKWDKRRAILIKMVPDVTYQSVSEGNSEFQKLLSELDGKSIEDYKKQIKAQIKRYKELKAEIPARISEAKNSLPEKRDYSEVEKEISVKHQELKEVEIKINNSYEAIKDLTDQNTAIEIEINELRSQLSSIEFETEQENKKAERQASGKIYTIGYEIEGKQKEINLIKEKISDARSNLEVWKAKKKNLLNEWNEVEKLKFEDSGDFICPVSGRKCCDAQLNIQDSDKRKNEFNQRLIESKVRINNEGVKCKEKIEQIEEEISELQDQEQKAETDLRHLIGQKEQLQENPVEVNSINPKETDKYKEIQAKINELEKSKHEIKRPDNSELISQKQALIQELDTLKGQLSERDAFSRITARIKELAGKEAEYNEQLNSLEKDEYTIELMEKARIDTLTGLVNEKFSMVNFKMFKQLINGGFEPTCETTANGVPYSDLNSAGKINAGLDIINTLSKHFDIQVPVWVDNAESILNMIPVNSQAIRLVVSEDKELKVTY